MPSATRRPWTTRRSPSPRSRGERHAGIATHDGLRLHARVHGPEDATATVVLAHGWTMAQEFWTPTAEALARQGIRTVTYDQRGHGRSSRPDADGFRMDNLGHDLDAILRAYVPAGSPTVLVGHSMGAMSVLSWAGRQSSRSADVRGAMLVSTSMHGVLPDAVAAITGSASPAIRAVLRQASRIPTPLPNSPLNRRIVNLVSLGENPSPHATELTHRLFMQTHPAVRAGFARQIDVLDVRAGAAALDVPTLVLVGTHDRLTPPSHAQALVNALPDARLQVLPGVGHQLPLERPREIGEIIRTHVRHTVPADTPARTMAPPVTGTG